MGVTDQAGADAVDAGRSAESRLEETPVPANDNAGRLSLALRHPLLWVATVLGAIVILTIGLARI